MEIKKKYNNTTYWQEMHQTYRDSLKAVGISYLSEYYNNLKYDSESNTILKILDKYLTPTIQDKEVSILDIGSGIGVWSHLLYKYYSQKHYIPRVTAIDISSDALESIRKKNEDINIFQIDLKTVKTDRFAKMFDCALAVCCFHHIVDLTDYLNALRFAAASIKPGGILIIEDPILTKPYSKFYQTDFSIFTGHSFPRPSYLIDDVMMREGLERKEIINALSFLLSGNMESYSKFGFFIQRKIWNFGYFLLYKSNRIVQAIAPMVRWADAFFKKTKYSNGTIFMVYRKC